MLAMYIVQGLIHGLFDTRRGGINPLLNTAALIGSIVITVNVYGWKMIWLPFVALMGGAVFGGILMGLLLRSHRRAEEKHQESKN